MLRNVIGAILAVRLVGPFWATVALIMWMLSLVGVMHLTWTVIKLF